MASMRDIKRRKNSISSTQQITKAMKLVSTVKLQQARAHAEETDPYFQNMYKTVSSLLSTAGEINNPYLKKQDSPVKAVIAISSNRGLAGGYNSNLVKEIMNAVPKENALIYSIGHKGSEILTARGYEMGPDFSDVIESPKYEDAMDISRSILKDYEEGKIGEIYLAYTHFKNTVSHEPRVIKLLPVELQEDEGQDSEEYVPTKNEVPMNFEPSPEEALDLIIPKYVTSLLYGGLVESVASENGARMTAMDSATSNAEEMIEDLTLKYNRARQGNITQELTEIIAGASALS
jgi:F-type H+-transporting ATPase subunit gamma